MFIIYIYRYLDYAERQVLPSNILKYYVPATKNDIPKYKRIFWERLNYSFDMGIIREWNGESPTPLATEVIFPAHHEHFRIKHPIFCAPLRLSCQILPNSAPATKNDSGISRNSVPATKSNS